MKILFIIGTTSRIRHFKDVIRLLVERGNSVTLAARPRKGELNLSGELEGVPVSLTESPTLRVDDWCEIVPVVRMARDYARYLSPAYARATRLVHRVQESAPPGFVEFCQRNPWVGRRWGLVDRGFQVVEDLIPSDRAFEDLLRTERPDVVLITPLVTFDQYQTDYVKAARKLGITTIFLPFSWDNLTNKGLMRVQPDWVIVWNEAQKREAVDLHGSRPDRVVVAGAPRFDEFFAMQPETTRAKFCKRAGLDPSKPFILYLGSSPLTGQNEVEFVQRWIAELRAASDARLRDCGILIRPHPVTRGEWRSVDLSGLPGVSVRIPRDRKNADQELYDSLYHAATVVGMNTSAFIEAGILGKSVHTILIPGFDEGQVGTLHFDLLLSANGGLLSVARDFDEHRRQLAETLADPTAASERSRRFVEGFVRPRGLDKPVSPILANEIERLARRPRRAREVAPVWHAPARKALRWWLDRRLSTAGGGAPGQDPLTGAIQRRAMHATLLELARGTDPIVVGPWFDDVATELLYWIPFVRWAAEHYQIASERLVAVSRGGVASWYGAIAGRYVDLYELFTPDEVRDYLATTVPHSKQHAKFLSLSPFERSALERLVDRLGTASHQLLHPSVMFRVLNQALTSDPYNGIRALSRYEPIGQSSENDFQDLPDAYVAVDFSFNEHLPDTAENRAFCSELVQRIASHNEVVLMTDGTVPGLVDNLNGATAGRIHLREMATSSPRHLEERTRILGRARAFVGSYSGLAHLASFQGTTSVSFFSAKVPRHQLHMAQEIYAGDRWGPFYAFRVADFSALQDCLGLSSPVEQRHEQSFSTASVGGAFSRWFR